MFPQQQNTVPFQFSHRFGSLRGAAAIGEVRGGEALDMLQAMNTGHEGSLSTARESPIRTLAEISRSAGTL